jgi:hypothetical protein
MNLDQLIEGLQQERERIGGGDSEVMARQENGGTHIRKITGLDRSGPDDACVFFSAS